MDSNEVEEADMESESLIRNMNIHPRKHWRNYVGYWLLGLCNNYAYVIMLSAAHDILKGQVNDVSPQLQSKTSAPTGSSHRDCNHISTGAVLLADVLPGLLVKIFAPFIVCSVHLKVMAVVLLCSLSFLLVSFCTTTWMAFVGVACAALGGGLGEVTFLGYSAYFNRNVVSSWSSGTGASGVFGALSYAAITSAGITPKVTVRIMLVIPALLAVTFWFFLKHPRLQLQHSDRMHRNHITCREKLVYIPHLMKYMVPLVLVYFCEYLINQGLYELIYFRDINWLSHEEQYRWFNVDYQIGVFISRSSVNLVRVRRLWIFAALQAVNLLFFMFEAVYLFVPSIWIVLVLVLFEGLLGGGVYVNSFYRIASETEIEFKEFAMSVTSIADTSGIALAGFLAIPIHNALCELPLL